MAGAFNSRQRRISPRPPRHRERRPEELLPQYLGVATALPRENWSGSLRTTPSRCDCVVCAAYLKFCPVIAARQGHGSTLPRRPRAQAISHWYHHDGRSNRSWSARADEKPDPQAGGRDRRPGGIGHSTQRVLRRVPEPIRGGGGCDRRRVLDDGWARRVAAAIPGRVRRDGNDGRPGQDRRPTMRSWVACCRLRKRRSSLPVR